LCQHAIRQRTAELEPRQYRKGVRRILLPPEDGQPHLADEHVAHFMDGGEYHIARDELDLVSHLLFGHSLESRGTSELAHRLVEPSLALGARQRRRVAVWAASGPEPSDTTNALASNNLVVLRAVTA
jgi:hypothetical protein